MTQGAPQNTPGRDTPRTRWSFKFHGFPIGAWWGPSASESEIKVYQEAGFNVLMVGRYMQLPDYADADKSLQELDLAQKYGLGALLDTYTMNTHPWGGQAGVIDPHPHHHSASLLELQWLYNKLGHHPALIGFMIGDDQGAMSQRTADCTDFLYRQPKPQLIPWLCGWITPKDLASHNNPISDPQIYPSLYQWNLSAEEQAHQYVLSYAKYSRECREQGVIFWPMLNTSHDTNGKTGEDAFGYCPSDSLVRFPAYAALAYGAEGLWYFTYNGGALEHVGNYHTAAEVHKGLTPLYPVVKQVNQRIAAWGSQLLGRTCTGVFSMAFGATAGDWPFKEELRPDHMAEAVVSPEPGKLVEGMSNDMIAGILTQPGKLPLVMVVDSRVSKNFGDLPTRTVKVRFAPEVRRINVLEGGKAHAVKGHEVALTLEAGAGQLLELGNQRLEKLTASTAITAVQEGVKLSPVPLTAADLPKIKAAKLRIDVFGSNSGEYAAKYIYLNGHQLAQVPTNDTDSWSRKIIDLNPDQLQWVQQTNQLTVRTQNQDAWKFRGLALAVQRADGVWTKTETDPTSYSSPDWAYSEGKTWGPDGVAGPIQLTFK